MPGVDLKSGIHTCYEGCGCHLSNYIQSQISQGKAISARVPGHDFTSKKFIRRAAQALRSSINYRGFRGPIVVRARFLLDSRYPANFAELQQAVIQLLKRAQLIRTPADIISWSDTSILGKSFRPGVDLLIVTLGEDHAQLNLS